MARIISTEIKQAVESSVNDYTRKRNLTRNKALRHVIKNYDDAIKLTSRMPPKYKRGYQDGLRYAKAELRRVQKTRTIKTKK